ncbi:MAG: DUF6691 family protein [Bacteroidota bacterium]
MNNHNTINAASGINNPADSIIPEGPETAPLNTKTETGLLPNFKYLAWGMLFGIVFLKAEIISWFRIQEMFRLQSFHMFGVIGSAVAVGMLSIFIIKKLNLKTLDGKHIVIQPKKFQKGQIYGSLIFGMGWAITGACPGPLFAQIGTGSLVVLFTLLSALAGTWFYGLIRNRLPH